MSTETVADGSEAPGYVPGTLNSLSATMQIDQRGVIRSVKASYQIVEPPEGSGRTQNYRTKFSINNIDETVAGKPSWVPTAVKKRPKVSAELTDDRRFVRFQINSGSPLTPKSYIEIFTNRIPSSSYTMRIENQVSTETDMYLYRSGDPGEYPNIGLTRGRRPSNVLPPRFGEKVDLRPRRGILGYFIKTDM